MSEALALVVDDEADIRELLTMTLTGMGIDTVEAGNLAEARSLLGRHKVSLCLTDMRLPDGDGLELVKHMAVEYQDIPVAVLTAYGNMELAVQALKLGAFDFVSKPVDLQMLRALINTALKLAQGGGQSRRLSKQRLLGESAAIEMLREKIDKLSRSQAPVHITGASGVGKELIARLIHDEGPRAGQPFIAVNCGAIPSELMESEFFGHVKGSFTGAVADNEGLFQAANGGTLFLDEIAELPASMQVKLLRAIQEKAVRPVGGHAEVPVDVRILSATHRDLAKLVSKSEFRKDLFYRINVIEMQVPSLRERPEDISILAEYILAQLNHGLEYPIKLADASLKALQAYSFPGNIRELENILERAITLCEQDTIEPADLALPDEDLNADTDEFAGYASLEDYLASIERGIILKTLRQQRWNRTAAAKQLGITLRALRYRLDKLGIDKE